MTWFIIIGVLIFTGTFYSVEQSVKKNRPVDLDSFSMLMKGIWIPVVDCGHAVTGREKGAKSHVKMRKIRSINSFQQISGHVDTTNDFVFYFQWSHDGVNEGSTIFSAGSMVFSAGDHLG